MLGIRNPFARRNPRYIFGFAADGQRRHADPLQVDAKLLAAGGDDWASVVVEVAKLRKPLSQLVAESIGAEAVAARKARFEQGVAKLAAMSRAAFELPPLDAATGRGVTDAEAIAILVEYLAFAESLAEDARPLA